ncbi:glycoside hydrolase family 13 protein [Sphaerisporangium sp. TRM90804]|uniref:glycoside hydrolase family 13 protein n=1 Tax=Sphaerisporangium sp. TRM90804 TaxID=3031113 RepID=UPI002448AA23|nr:glycoside hydrolase family 13 protein [Sphaerisporangium sp. TRM90804]MDH2426160.1 glycoside hydrolase family 13 protein [Sphaerisporangium sp. TRM90804]
MTGQRSTAQGGPAAWWRDAVIYQIYVRSFADGDGDGVGDLAGIRSRLPYLAGLGVDAVWITPWFDSPMADGGYDVADFRAIAPLFGTLAEAEALIGEAHDLGLRVILDIVPNHTSDRHRWFAAARDAGPGSPERARYWFRPGRGPGGEDPPNDWRSVFGGPAWTRLVGVDGAPEEWYLHLFAPEQPDLNWSHPQVRAEFESILRFWFDRGVDGFRVDVAHGLAKDPELPDLGAGPGGAPAPLVKPIEGEQGGGRDLAGRDLANHPHWDREEVHEVYRAWRRVADSYAPTPGGARMFVAEAWRVRPGGLARYLRADELDTAFNFDLARRPWRAGELRRGVQEHLAALRGVRATPTWVLSSHDLTRHVTRYGRTEGGVDVELGRRRARAAALLVLALPGSVYVYQGEELGLAEVEDLPEEALRDPMWRRSGGVLRGRDGCRVPLPWSAGGPALGFGAGAPWLPQPPEWAGLSVAVQDGDPDSTLRLYRSALRLRRSRPEFRRGELCWVDSPEGVLAFDRGAGLRCVVNLSPAPCPLPAGRRVLLSSGPVAAGVLPSDTAAWLAPAPAGDAPGGEPARL